MSDSIDIPGHESLMNCSCLPRSSFCFADDTVAYPMSMRDAFLLSFAILLAQSLASSDRSACVFWKVSMS